MKKLMKKNQKNVEKKKKTNKKKSKSKKEEEKVVEEKKDFIVEVSDGISKNLAPKLSAISSEIFKNLTSSKYGQVYMQKNYDVLIKDKNIDRPSASFSSGTIDQVYLSLRIAISEIISKKTLPSKIRKSPRGERRAELPKLSIVNCRL